MNQYLVVEFLQCLSQAEEKCLSKARIRIKQGGRRQTLVDAHGLQTVPESWLPEKQFHVKTVADFAVRISDNVYLSLSIATYVTNTERRSLAWLL
jgi:hypothetical protein